MRKDVGLLWESYVVVERLNHNYYADKLPNSYFGRTYEHQERDLMKSLPTH